MVAFFYPALTCPDNRGPGAQLPQTAYGKGFTLALVTLKGSSSNTMTFTARSSVGLCLLGAFLSPVPALLACVCLCPDGIMQSTRAERPCLSGFSCCPWFPRVQFSWEETRPPLC